MNMNKTKKTAIFRKVALTLAFALVITSFSGISNVNKAQAAMTAGNVVYEGNGSLTCGSATLKLENGVLTYIGSTTKKYWDNPVAGTMLINQRDRLGHVFLYAGIYFVIDMDNGTIIQAYKNSSNSYCLKSSGTAVYGSSAYMATINTCIIDDEWFYQENMAKMQRLMTRAEFDKISNGQDPTVTATPVPTETATPVPTTTVTPVPTATVTPVPTATVTPVPTATVTPVPTATVTPVPTATVTPVPTATVTPVPTATPDIKIDFDFTFWWEQYTSGKITWEQFTQIIWQNKWKIDSQTTEKETTYYFYDESGKLIRTERVLISNRHDDGSGSGSANASNSGKADIDISNKGNGGASGTITVVNNSSSSSKKKAVVTWSVRRSGNWISLIRTVNGKSGSICKVKWNKKKHYATFDGIKYKKIKYVGYTATSKMIIMRTSKGKIKIVTRNKGKEGKKYTAKTLKGTWKKCIEDVRGLTIRVSDGKKKVMGVKNAKPKKLKS